MRKISFIMAALALVLGVTQCKKENKPLANGETQRIVLTASNGNDGSKVAVNEATTMLNLTWESTDVIMASGAVEGTLSYKSGAESDIATFEGSVTRKEGDQVVFTVGAAPASFENQSGNVEWIKGHMHLEGTADYNEDGVYGEDEEVEMKLQYAVLKLDLSALGTEVGNVVTISNASGTVATVAGVKTATKVYYVAMPAAASTKYTFSGNGKSVEKTWALENNIFYTKNDSGDAIVIEPDAPTPGGTVTTGNVEDVTAVSAKVNYSIEPNAASQATEHGVCYGTSANPEVNGSHVVYLSSSMGATDYSVTLTGLASETKYYARAYARYAPAKDGNEVIVYGSDVEFTTTASAPPTAPDGALSGLFTVGIGDDGEAGTDDDVKVYFSKGNLYYDGENWGFEAMQYYFRTYSGKDKCDAAGYSTSGTAEGHWGLFGWSTGSNSYGMSTSYQDSDYSGDFVDWGKNIGDGKTWRTLTGGSGGEWDYLLNTRTMMTNGKPRYTNKTGGITIDGTTYNGLFIYPDDYSGDQVGATDGPSTWDDINKAGIVFLPAAGYRDGTSVNNVGSYSEYWSSSYDDSGNACYLDFGSQYVDPDYYDDYRYYGYSVRLVSEN